MRTALTVSLFAFIFASLLVSRTALAADPPAHVEPAPGQAAAAAPAPGATPITATCSLGDHPGIDDAEAKTGADVVCHELARHGATNTTHEVRFGKLGGKTMVTLASRNGNTYDERRTFVSGLDELDVAAPRMAAAIADGKTLAETRNVDNVMTAEARQPRMQRGSVAVEGSLFGTTAVGATAGASAGFGLGIVYRAGNFGVNALGRAGGIGSSDDKLGVLALDVGGRYYLSSGDTAPFVGAGIGISHFNLERQSSGDLEGEGFGAYGAIGVDFLRTHHVALSTSLRIDTPFYALEGHIPYDALARSDAAKASSWVAPLSLNVGLLFH